MSGPWTLMLDRRSRSLTTSATRISRIARARPVFARDENERGQRTNQRLSIHGDAKVTVDFLIAPSLPNDKPGGVRNIEQDFAAIIAPGLHLAFLDRCIRHGSAQYVKLASEVTSAREAKRSAEVLSPITRVPRRILPVHSTASRVASRCSMIGAGAQTSDPSQRKRAGNDE